MTNFSALQLVDLPSNFLNVTVKFVFKLYHPFGNTSARPLQYFKRTFGYFSVCNGSSTLCPEVLHLVAKNFHLAISKSQMRERVNGHHFLLFFCHLKWNEKRLADEVINQFILQWGVFNRLVSSKCVAMPLNLSDPLLKLQEPTKRVPKLKLFTLKIAPVFGCDLRLNRPPCHTGGNKRKRTGQESLPTIGKAIPTGACAFRVDPKRTTDLRRPHANDNTECKSDKDAKQQCRVPVEIFHALTPSCNSSLPGFDGMGKGWNAA